MNPLLITGVGLAAAYFAAKWIFFSDSSAEHVPDIDASWASEMMAFETDVYNGPLQVGSIVDVTLVHTAENYAVDSHAIVEGIVTAMAISTVDVYVQEVIAYSVFSPEAKVMVRLVPKSFLMRPHTVK